MKEDVLATSARVRSAFERLRRGLGQALERVRDEHQETQSLPQLRTPSERPSPGWPYLEDVPAPRTKWEEANRALPPRRPTRRPRPNTRDEDERIVAEALAEHGRYLA